MAHANIYYSSYSYVFCVDIRGWHMLISIIVATVMYFVLT